MTNDSHDMTQLTDRAERLIAALTGSILGTVEVAAERLSLAADVARVTQRLAAFSAVLEAVGAQKDALNARLAGASGPLRALLLRQLELLTAQECAVLEKAGAPPEAARAAAVAADAGRLFRRDGSRFVAVGAGGDGVAAAGG